MGGGKASGGQIWQAYEGEFGEDLQRRARERIHWVCNQVKGPSVLDIGCSQGICDILLGREGFCVTGIDLDAEAVACAASRLEKEEPATQRRVQFFHRNFTDIPSEERTYDTIIITEVLGDLTHPEALLQRAASTLKENGQVIVSVPFGVNDQENHRGTYYLSTLLRQMEECFFVSKVQFFDRCLACVGTLQRTERNISLDMALLEQEEQAFCSVERPLRDQLKAALQEAAQQKKALAQQTAAQRESFARYESQLQEQRQAAVELERQIQAGMEELQIVSQQFAEQKQKLTQLLQKEQADKEVLRSEFEGCLQAKTQELEETSQKLLEREAEQEVLNRQNIDLKNELTAFKKSYDTLAASKLGRCQLRIWNRRTARRYRPAFRVQLRNLAKQIPFLVALVRLFRGQKAEAKQALSDRRTADGKQVSPPAPVDMDYYERIRPLVEQIPESNGSRYYRKIKRKIGWITDQILYDSFKSAADGILLTPENWQDSLGEIDWLFIISGWHGIKDEWNGFARPDSPKRKIIYQVIDVCKANGIPTVFHSVEDPPNYERFIGIAQRCDHVFTAAAEMLPRYRQDCGHDRVYQLCYGFDPILHNPVGIRSVPRQPEVFFAGSWMKKYPERGQDMRLLFDGVIRAGKSLKIVDRNLHLHQEEYRFPNQYSSFLAPPLEHSVLQRVHKLYDWVININSVKESATMFANRTYELQAMGRMIVSNYSVGVNSLLPDIFTCQHSEEISFILNSMTEEELYEHQIMSVRLAMRGNTCYERVAEILNLVGIPTELPVYQVAVVAEEDDGRLQEAFAHQTYPHKTLVTPAQLAADYDCYDLIAFFRPGAVYGDFYLEDLINGFKYTDSDYITKAGFYRGSQYIAGPEHDYVSLMPDKYRTVFWAKAFQLRQLLDMKGSVPLKKGYSIDRFMFNEEESVCPPEPESYEITVIVPVFNNGSHLYGKAFSSLRRSSLFPRMEILLVDDGSTDPCTAAVVRSLAARYANVKSFFFGDGGSGSASRPRNKGVELASAPYITFLDPDNEAVNDAYAVMLRTAQERNADIVVGNMIRFRLKEELANYNYYFKKYWGAEEVAGDKREFLSKILFTPMSIQAMVIRRCVITEAGITQVVGAVGQDSFFSWQLFVNAGRIVSIPLAAHIYYALVQNSTVNSVTNQYFERSLLQERVQRNWLEENGLLEAYMESRFTVFFRDWYLKKLHQAKPEQESNCGKLLWKIFQLYAPYYHGTDKQIQEFIQKYGTSQSAEGVGIEANTGS